jgi:hypothetical protein
MSETANSYSSLFSDIQAINATTTQGNYTITLGADITAGGDLEAISLASGVNLTINGAGFTYSGNGLYEGLFVYQGNVTVQNLTIADAVAQGGAGGSGGGGGGAGLGGGLFVAGTTDGAGSVGGNVTLSGVTFTDDSALGGAGGAGVAGGAGGGGGLGGAGGSGNAATPGGGGGIGATATGSSHGSAAGTGIIPGTGGGGASGVGGGIGVASGVTADRGGYGGGGGGTDSRFGGNGGFGGGGGAASATTGGNGGFGGGGGAGTAVGTGGFGGGQGGGSTGASGGGGLGAGGDIFVQAGGHLTIESGTLNAGTVQGGSGANAGESLGSALFLESGQLITLAPAVATTLTIAGGIDGNPGYGGNTGGLNATQANAGVVINGAGAVLLAGSAGAGAGSFATTIDSGTLILGTTGAAGIGDISFNGTGTLAFTSAAFPSNMLDGFTYSDVIDITNFASTGDVDANGSGVLSLDNGAISLNFGTAGANDAFALSSDGAGGTDIALIPPNQFGLLNDEISAADAATSGSFAITLSADALASGAIDAISLHSGVTLIIDGAGHTLNAEGLYAGLAIEQGNVTVQNLTIANAVAQGAGGGVSIGTGGTVAVTLSNVGFIDDTATGSPAYGGDIYIASGQSITIDGGMLGAGTVVGNPALGSDLYLAAGAGATLAAPAGTTLAVDGSIYEAGSATLVLNGPGTVDFVTPNTLSSPVQLDHGTLLLGAAGAATVSFATGTSATLAVTGTVGDNGTIGGFGFGDEIDITGLSLSGSTVEALNGADQLVVSDASLAVTLTFAPSLSNEIFGLKSDGHGGAEILLRTVAASSFSQLNTAIADIDAATLAGNYTIDLASGITNLQDLTAISLAAGVSLTIDGLGHTLSGGGQYEGLFVYQGDVTVQNLTIADAVAQGGAGGYGGGGGGAGLGGGLFIAGSSAGTGSDVTLSAVSFIDDSALGGAGGQPGPTGDGGGGGGLGGAGGSDNGLQGGGGGVGNQASGGSGTAGAAGIIPGASGGNAYGGTGGGASGGGGGGGNDAGGGGVGGHAGIFATQGGTGGFGGGGGGSSEGGGGGGFGGGGGGADGGGNGGLPGGAGGFGGGGGGGESTFAFKPSGAGGFGAGAGSNGAGGGGLGAGGDIFVQAGASLTIESGSLGAGTVAGGSGANAGSALGSDLFLQGDQWITLSPGIGTVVTISGAIDDEAGAQGTGGLVLNGAGRVLLAGDAGGAVSDYTGGTTIESGGLILGSAGAAGSGNIVFGGGDPPSLTFSTADAPTNTIAGFTFGDTIDITDLGISSGETLYLGNGGILVIPDSHASAGTLDLTFASGTPQSFTLSTDGSGGADLTPLCYLRGTLIRTSTGEKPVETLQIGDEVVTRFGGVQKIKWIGVQSYDPRFIANNPVKLPVRITAGALGGGLPKRDLLISPGHSMLLGETLILASSLVNGVTIRQERAGHQIDYFQLEFLRHDCVQAEGAWSESFADGPGLRAQFHNAAAFWRLYPEYQTPGTLNLCAPRPERGPALQAALAPLVARARQNLVDGPLQGAIDRIDETGIAGWALDLRHPWLPVALEIRLSGRRYAEILACEPRTDLRAEAKGNGQCAFTLERALPADLLPFISVHRASDGAEIFAPGQAAKRGAA